MALQTIKETEVGTLSHLATCCHSHCYSKHDHYQSFVYGRVLSRKIILGGKLVLRAVLVAPGGGGGRGVCPLPCESWKLSPF